MSTRPKFDPSRVASLLSRGAEEGRAPLGDLPPPSTPVLAAVPLAGDEPKPPETGSAAVEPIKRPITVRLTEEVLHALMRHQAEVRCQPGARLGDTTIGGVIDSLLRGPLGL